MRIITYNSYYFHLLKNVSTCCHYLSAGSVIMRSASTATISVSAAVIGAGILLSITLRVMHKTLKIKTSRRKTEQLRHHVHAGNTPLKIKSIKLAETEGLIYLTDLPAISTITWFTGNYRTATPILEQRMRWIIKKNPWIRGRIVKDRSSLSSALSLSAYQLCYPVPSDEDDDDYNNVDIHGGDSSDSDSDSNSNIDISDCFTVVDPHQSPISRSSDFATLGNIIARAQVSVDDRSSSRSGSRSLFIKNAKGQPTFKVTILPCATNPNTKFAVMVQMSHVLGDGATYYQLIDMLCSISRVNGSDSDSDDNNIIALDPERKSNFQELQIKAMGKEEEGYLTSMGNVLRFMYGMVKSKLSAPPIQFRFGVVDPDKIAQLKSKLNETEQGSNDAPSYISTNDIITSWFMKATNCPTGVMAINWRNRLQGVKSTHAGNYENVIFYQKQDFVSPSLIRQSLKVGAETGVYQRAVTKEDGLPGTIATIRNSNSIVTNWASFAKKNEIGVERKSVVDNVDADVCVEDVHLPIASSDAWPESMPLLKIFRAGVNKLGLCYYDTGGTNPLDKCPFLLVK